MQTPTLPRPVFLARLALALLAIAAAAAPGRAQYYSPNNPLDVAQRELDKAETDAEKFTPQAPARIALENRAQQLRTQIAESFAIYGPGISKPGLYAAKPGLTLTEAIKLAGGTTAAADRTGVVLDFTAGGIHGRLTGVRVDLTHQLQPDPVLLPTLSAQANNSAGFGPPAPTNYAISAGDKIRILVDEFRFEGGTPQEFLKAIDACFLANHHQVATIPPEADEVRVPKIQLSLKSANGARRKYARDILNLYNTIAASQPALGKWIVEGVDGLQPDLLMFVMSQPAVAAPPLRTRSISLVGIPRERWAGLERELAELNDSAAALGAKVDPPGAPRRFTGSVQLSPGAGVLLVIGNMEYIELVDTFIGAKRYEAANTKSQ
jgi:hypothetical protein